MADIRIKDLATTATTTASDDFMAVDGATNGTRKMNAAAPAFLTSVTTPSLTSPAATNLTLGLGTGGTALTLTNSTLAAAFAGVITTTSASGTVVSIPSGADNNRVIAIRNSGDTFSAFIGMSAAGNYVGSGANGDVMIRNDGGNIGFSANNAGVYYNGLFSPAGLAVTGTVSISSTTAGASNAGALVVQGGISAGQSAQASYFGGSISFPSDQGIISTVNDGRLFLDGSLNQSGGSIVLFGSAHGSFPAHTIYSANTHVYKNVSGTQQLSLSLTAATFAGAVTIGNTVNSVSPTSPNRTVTMVVNGVTLYLAAKTTND